MSRHSFTAPIFTLREFEWAKSMDYEICLVKLPAPSLRLSGFAKNGPPDWMPHIVVGTMEVLAAGMSKAR